MEKQKKIQNRKWWFRALKKIIKIRYKKPTFIYLGEEISNGALVLSNHEGTDAPMSFEIYSNKAVRFWGAYQMNSGLKKLYSYQTKVYYHEKKHWNLFAARMFCLLASPLTNIFYKGLNLISTYPDTRLINTYKQSLEALKNGENLVIFPEKSSNGYQDVLEGFHAGFVLFADYCKKNGIDVPIYVSYFNKKKKLYLIDKPIMYSELSQHYSTREEICAILCAKCNRLGEMTRDNSYLNIISNKNDKIETQNIN